LLPALDAKRLTDLRRDDDPTRIIDRNSGGKWTLDRLD
jgi:hypothetical protein